MNLKIKKSNPIVTIILLFIYCCTIGCGSLDGGIGASIYFPTSKKKLEIAIDSLYAQYPEYKIPKNWKQYDSWSARGYDFIESRIFHFKKAPEEMYYVTFVGDSTTLADTTKIAIGISAVNKGSDKWLLNSDFSASEKGRIEKRFNDEIVTKLKQYVKANTSR